MAVRRRQLKQQRGPAGEAVVWDFFSFPVLAGFSAGMLTMAACVFILGPLFFFIFLGALFLATFCASHILFTGGRQRREATKRSREEEDELERRIVARRENEDATGISSRRARKRRNRA